MKIKISMRYFIAIALFTFISFRIYYRTTDDFRIGNIMHDMPHQESWEIADLSTEENSLLEHIFNQKFTYIGKGAQSYAFASEDDKYVIKFFKFKHLKPSWFVDNLPSISPLKEFREIQQYKKKRKLLSVFNGYRLAYDVHKPESGLIYVHLNKSNNLKKQVTVKDKIGFTRSINLDDVNFVVQEKVLTSRKVIFDALGDGDVALAKMYIHKLFDLYLSEYSKGIYDHDHGVLHNTGFANGKPVHLDVGKLYRDENIHKSEYSQKDLTIVATKIAQRVYDRFPEYHKDLVIDMDNYFKEVFNQSAGLYEKCCLRQ
ncbi:MAG: hypothetical protein VX777_02280 [Chlamydiota bacterium]|nr:hypothetical protein [Chlamydiota bacterium]